jgi:hypothetical protein
MTEPRDPVILVHGLWMTGLEFGVLRQRLQTRHGFDAHVFSYPSMHGQVDEIVAELAQFAHERAAAPVMCSPRRTQPRRRGRICPRWAAGIA